MKAVVKLVNHPAKIIDIPWGEDPNKNLKEIQGLIGGYAEQIVRGSGVQDWVLLADEDGRLKELPPNIVFVSLPQPIVGTVLVVGMEQPEMVSLSDKAAAQIKKMLDDCAFTGIYAK